MSASHCWGWEEHTLNDSRFQEELEVLNPRLVDVTAQVWMTLGAGGAANSRATHCVCVRSFSRARLRRWNGRDQAQRHARTCRRSSTRVVQKLLKVRTCVIVFDTVTH